MKAWWAVIALALSVTNSANATSKNIWVSQAEIQALPITAQAYLDTKAWGNPTAAWDSTWVMADQDAGNGNNGKGRVLAAALVWAKEGLGTYRAKAAREIKRLYETYDTDAELNSASPQSRTLGMSRNITQLVLAADIIDLEAYDPAFNNTFNVWLDTLRTHTFTQVASAWWRTLNGTHENGGNNWSAWAGSARVAIDIYRGYTVDLARADSVFRALGDRSYFPTYSKWVPQQGYYAKRAELKGCWTCDTVWANWTEINPPCYSALYTTVNIDGAPTDDMGRPPGCGGWPPSYGSGSQGTYCWESIEGHVLTAELLYRAGYTSAFNYNNNMVKRELDFMNRASGFVGGNYATMAAATIPLANYRYGTNYPLKSGTCLSRSYGFTNWTTQLPVLVEKIRGQGVTGDQSDATALESRTSIDDQSIFVSSAMQDMATTPVSISHVVFRAKAIAAGQSPGGQTTPGIGWATPDILEWAVGAEASTQTEVPKDEGQSPPPGWVATANIALQPSGQAWTKAAINALVVSLRVAWSGINSQEDYSTVILAVPEFEIEVWGDQ